MKISQEMGDPAIPFCDLHNKTDLAAAKKTFILHHVIMKYKCENINIETNSI